MYRQPQHGSAGADQFHLSTSSGSSPFSQSQFASPVYGIDPTLHASPQHHLHPHINRQSPHMRPSSAGSDTSATMNPQRSIASRQASATPGPSGTGFRPSDRSLPSRDVSKESIPDAFVQFILYCNPNFPLDIDTTTLRSTFAGPPKSDNKDFETFRLFELIRKFDAKEIKTWGQLALDLGVEQPDTSKGQSVQKVQQYTVRLKRWMRAMHVDAFFEYLLGKEHSYFNAIPPPKDPYPVGGRDGVLVEEDLAIRALDPSFRPKRGRRRNSENDPNEESEVKQVRMIESAAPYSAAPMSAMPMSAHPDSFHDPWAIASAVTPQSFAPWSGRPSAPPSALPGASHLRWQIGQSGTPSTPHPMSAIPTSMSTHIDAAFDGEPRSAVTPSSRKRRRHGPAVSSAWSSNNAPGAKPRGRPPANRNVQDGPYGTFPADPANERSKQQSSLPTPLTAEERPSIEQSPPQMQPPSFIPEGRPGRLSLQVPQHTGNPVRLATPPMLLVNGETKESETRSDSDDATRQVVMAPPPNVEAVQQTSTATKMPDFTPETLKRVVASDLLRADIVGRRQRLTGDEAKRLADAMLDRLAVPRSETGDPRDDLARLTAASWLGVGDQVHVPLGPSVGHGKRIKVTQFRTNADGYEEISFDEETDSVREVFDIYWNASQGGCMGSFEMKGLSMAGPEAATAESTESTHDLVLRKAFESVQNIEKEGWLQKGMLEVGRSTARASRGGGDDNVDWKAKYLMMEFSAKIAKGEVERVKQRILERLMDVVL